MMSRLLIFKIIFFASVIFGMHYTINYYVLNQALAFNTVLKINIFISLLTFVVIKTLEVIKNKFPDKVGFGYLAFVLIKMLVSVVFLFPFIKEKPINLKVTILSFFLIFFIHLIFEVFVIIKSLKKQ